jgi:hypothetical protein
MSTIDGAPPNVRFNRAAVKAVARDQLNLVGMGVYGPSGAVDKALKNVRLHS